jgi:DNA-binding transcriptional MerR regulator
MRSTGDSAEPSSSELMTAAEATTEFGIRAPTLRQWVSRGYLSSVGRHGRAALYERGDVEMVKRRTLARTPYEARWPALHIPSKYSDRLITTTEAATLLRTSPSTVRSWVTRGRLVPAGRLRNGHLFTVGSVLRAGIGRGRGGY